MKQMTVMTREKMATTTRSMKTSVNDDDENKDVLKNNFLTAIKAFSEDVIKRVESDFYYYKKSVTSFTKKKSKCRDHESRD